MSELSQPALGLGLVRNEKIELIGTFVEIIESVLSPRPLGINVWHLPGALQRIISSIFFILTHGCKKNSQGECQLWNFIFGLRVIRPDLWPTYELKSVGLKSSNEHLVMQWLELSLQSHLCYVQLKALLADRKRIHFYYHDWAFVRSKAYVEAFFTSIQALEQNSQDTLATLNPSLMVKFYSKRKKQMPEKKMIHTPNGLCNSNRVLTNCGIKNLEESKDHLTPWEEEYRGSHSSKLSPSFFKVDYNVFVPSDGEKSETKCNDTFSSMLGDESNQKAFKEDFPHSSVLSPIEPKMSGTASWQRQRSLREKTPESDSAWPNNIRPYTTSADDVTELMESLLKDHSLFVKPSRFLIEYLSSKSKLYPKQRNIPKDINSHIVSHLFLSDDSSEIRCPTLSPNRASSSSTTLISSSLPLGTEIKANKSTPNKLPQRPVKIWHTRSHSDGVTQIVQESPMSPASLSYADKSSSSQMLNKGLSVRKRFMEDGGQSITPEADGFFPHPQPGQDLIDFLTSSQFAKTSAQLDRENAHFNIAEAVLAAIEQMNYETHSKAVVKPRLPAQDESEDDFYSNKKITNRRRLRVRSRITVPTYTSDDDPVTTDYSIFDSPETESSRTSESEELLLETPTENVAADDIESSCAGDPSLAENVAISILMQYNSRLLPKASELQWLVSEQDAPQKLLPMPSSIPVSPDDAEGGFQPLLRGTSDWAPPRPQLILTLHKNTKRRARLIAQKWRCAGCGLVVSEKLSSHFRLCHYLGRFFCTICHSNKKAVVPAKILHKWDFTKYAVCNFSSELLSRMSLDPLFHIGTLNPRLYKQCRNLHQTLIYRLQLFHARIYISTCSRATKEKTMLDAVPNHWATDPHVYSMDDLIAVKKGNIAQQIKQLTATCIKHISNCQICVGQGFICEICRDGSVIFPFQLDAVTQCMKCKGCFHFVCFSPNRSCPRCQRRDRRGEKESS